MCAWDLNSTQYLVVSHCKYFWHSLLLPDGDKWGSQSSSIRSSSRLDNSINYFKVLDKREALLQTETTNQCSGPVRRWNAASRQCLSCNRLRRVCPYRFESWIPEGFLSLNSLCRISNSVQDQCRSSIRKKTEEMQICAFCETWYETKSAL